MSAVPALRDGASPLVVGLLLLPAVGAGLLAGTRSLPWYYATAAVIAVFAAMFSMFLAVLAVCVAVVVAGSLLHFARCWVTGTPLFRPGERQADDPVSAGSCRVSGGVSGAEDATIATASPTGDELPKRRFY